MFIMRGTMRGEGQLGLGAPLGTEKGRLIICMQPVASCVHRFRKASFDIMYHILCAAGSLVYSIHK